MYDRLIERGTILKSSWSPSGRDCAFYQVVNRSRTHAIIREIDALYPITLRGGLRLAARPVSGAGDRPGMGWTTTTAMTTAGSRGRAIRFTMR